MKTPKKDSQTMAIALDPNPKGKFKRLGGSLADDWNMRLVNLVAGGTADRSIEQRGKQQGERGCLWGYGRYRSD